MKEFHPRPLRAYVLVWLALLALLLGTAISAYLAIDGWHLPISVGVSILKTTLVMAFFMNLTRERGTTAVFALAGFAWLAVLIGLTLADVMTR